MTVIDHLTYEERGLIRSRRFAALWHRITRRSLGGRPLDDAERIRALERQVSLLAHVIVSSVSMPGTQGMHEAVKEIAAPVAKQIASIYEGPRS